MEDMKTMADYAAELEASFRKINVGDILGVHLYNDIDLKLKLEQIVAETNIKTAVNGQFAKYIFKCTDELLAVVRGKHHPAYGKNIWYIDKQ